MGVKESLTSGPETEVPLFHVGAPENINDEDLTTRVDTWNGDQPGTVSFVGIVWSQPLTTSVSRLELTLATFFDGGWFGVNNRGPGAGGALKTNDLVEPNIEISTDGGTTWKTVPHTSDYISSLTGHGIGGGANPNPSSVSATFTLSQPATDISGLRIIGTEGGTASGGFLGVFELAVRSASSDSDNDGMEDGWEGAHGLTVGTNDAAADPDGDGLSNLQEFNAKTDPQAADTDTDTLKDGDEVNTYKTNPLRADTDADTLSDGDEVNKYKTNPLVADTDSDGFSDALEVRQNTDPTSGTSFPTNLAPLGTGIMGTKESLDSGTETPLFHAGGASAINDADLTTSVDTYNGGDPGTVSFVGILWDQPLTRPIERLELTLATFFDGGWFGVNNVGPGSGGTLSATEHLTAPVVQVTTNRGTNWVTVPATTDYVTALTDHPLPDVDFGPPTPVTAKFTLASPQTGVNGVRIIGQEGGTASGGFLGVFDLAVFGGSATVQGVTLSNAGLANGQFRFEFETKSGTTYEAQYETSAAGPWQKLTTITGDGTRKEVTDKVTDPVRLYRVRSQ